MRAEDAFRNKVCSHGTHPHGFRAWVHAVLRQVLGPSFTGHLPAPNWLVGRTLDVEEIGITTEDVTGGALLVSLPRANHHLKGRWPQDCPGSAYIPVMGCLQHVHARRGPGLS